MEQHGFVFAPERCVVCVACEVCGQPVLACSECDGWEPCEQLAEEQDRRTAEKRK